MPDSYRSLLAQRSQPSSSQFGMSYGVPLYPVETIRPSLTMTAPMRLPVQLARARTAMAMPIMYSSTFGLSFAPDGLSDIWIAPFVSGVISHRCSACLPPSADILA